MNKGFYTKKFHDNELITNIAEDLLLLVDIIAGCTDLHEVYYDTDEDLRYVLRKFIEPKFLPKEVDE